MKTVTVQKAVTTVKHRVASSNKVIIHEGGALEVVDTEGIHHLYAPHAWYDAEISRS